MNSYRWLRIAAPIALFSIVLSAVSLWRTCAPRPPPLATVDLVEACTDDWIGIRASWAEAPGDESQETFDSREAWTCPEGWEWVFSPDPAQPPPPGLQRFCRYVGEAQDPRPGVVETPFVAHPPFERIVRDCWIVGPAAETLFPPQPFSAILEGRFRQEAGWIGPQNSVVPSSDVRLAIIDSFQDDSDPSPERVCAPAGLGSLECSPHGEVLIRLARDLLCTGGACSARITTRRVLRRTHEVRAASRPSRTEVVDLEDAAGVVQGGFAGTAQDLAKAIRREVQLWWEAPPPRPRLILNLSVGWEPIYAPSSSGLAELVRAAIQDGVCRDALFIAAAGNRVAGPPALQQPILPAAWEQEPAPAPQVCARLLEAPPPQLSIVTAYRPLVFAVGGVERGNRPLSISRPKSTPPLVAFGDHAPVYDPDNLGLKILTGTSVSSLVVSAAAAEHWRKNLQLASFDVIAGLRAGGQKTGLPIDFCLKPSQTNCPPGQGATRILVHPPGEWSVPWPPQFEASKLKDLKRSASLKTLTDLPFCDPRNLWSAGPLPIGAAWCPQSLYDIHATPWLGPHPGANHNPACSFSFGSPGTLVLEFDPCFRVQGKPARLEDFSLVVGDQAYRLPVAGFELGDPAAPCPQPNDERRRQVVLTDLEFGDPPHPMYLAVRVNGEFATLSPILHIRRGDQ